MFHSVVKLPTNYAVLDLSERIPEDEILRHAFAIGKYNEKRGNTYTTPLFGGTRNIHMGIDIFAAAGTPVFAFTGGEVHSCGYNPAAGDYGHVIVIRHRLDRLDLFALYGHLSAASIHGKRAGAKINAGEVVGWLGDRLENGGWLPHLHFQLSFEAPLTHDLPGVVSADDHELALLKYPDPRLVLGPLY